MHSRTRMNWHEMADRYPRLVRAMQDVAILSPSEAVSCLDAHLYYNDCSSCACEAVTHFCAGGPVTQLIDAAWRFRRYSRRPTTQER